MEESQTVEDMKKVILDTKRHLFPEVVNDPGCFIAQRASIRDKGNLTHEDVLKDPSVDEESMPPSFPLTVFFPSNPPAETISIVVRLRDLYEDFIGGIDPLFHTPTKPIAEVKISIRKILERYSHTMHILVTKAGREPLNPLWIPKAGSGDASDEASRSHMPDVRGMPSSLLHELGSIRSKASIISKKQAQYFDRIFTLNDHTVLINTSGSGKTRLGLRGFCQYWGFYGIVKKASDNIGSGDFWKLMSTLGDPLGYDKAKSLGSRNEKAAQHMEQKVKHRVMQFLLARFLLLNLLISEASKCDGGLRPPDHRTLWALLQARPTDMFEKDPFMELADVLQLASTEDLKAQIKAEYSTFQSALKHVTGASMDRPLYCFLDEVQATTTLRMGGYRSHNAAKERPLLRLIWEMMTRALESTQMLTILYFQELP